MTDRISLDVVDSLGPFGTADAAHAGGWEGFIDFEGVDGIATRSDDLRARVIVGRKGAGKTLYLRRARAYAASADELYADDIQQNLPGTTEIVKVANVYPKGVLVEKWMGIWRGAVLRSVASHMLHNRRLASHMTPEDKRSLREDFPEVMGSAGDARTPLSVYSQVTELINSPKFSRRWLDEQIGHRRWEELEYRIGELLDQFPVLCFYIDAVDEEFRHAPAYWLMCQKGLFYQVMRFLRDTRLGGRLHLFICIRDLTYSSVFGSEHATRYLDRVHIRLLEWDSGSIRFLFESKIGRLEPSLSRNSSSIAEWLGTEVVYNERRQVEEPVAQYVLRHTRLLPRDVVVLGNEIVARMRDGSGAARPLTDEGIRDVVRRCAVIFGREQLEVCANQITADMMHEGAALQEISELYTGRDPTFQGAQMYFESMRDKLGTLIRSAGRDRFDREMFRLLRERGEAMFSGFTDPLAILWQNGLLGIVPEGLSDGRAVFYSPSAHHELLVDDYASEYVFHPCLIDALRLPSQGPGSLPVHPVAFDEI